MLVVDKRDASLISLCNETKGFFCFAFDRKMLPGKVPFLAHVFISKTKSNPAKKIQGNAFQLK